jgi:arsenite/tail-anchored protein-transporting ATPase
VSAAHQPKLGALQPKLGALRAVMMTGKGGVGKSTLTAALARHLAQQNIRVLCTELVGSPDADSPLARLLGVQHAGSEPVAVGPNLSFARVDPSAGHLSFLRSALPLKVMADAAMKSSAIRRFLMAAPSLPEMGSLYRLLELTELRLPNGEPRYQTLVCDLPATGHAVALAQIPASILNVLDKGPIADAVRRGLDLLYDANKSAAIIVTLPETLPVSESLELGASLKKHGIPLRGIVLNRAPWSPFSEAELSAVEAALVSTTQSGGGQVRGARLFGRIRRAEVARARLREAGATVLADITEQSLEGSALIDSLLAAVSTC